MDLISAIPIAAIGISYGVRGERHSRLAKRFGGLTDDLGGFVGFATPAHDSPA